MQIIHISLARDLAAGPSRQIKFEVQAASRIKAFEWHVVAYQDVSPTSQEIARVPRFFRGMFLRNLFFWYLVIRSSRRYDYVLTRHVTFDPFAYVFSWMIPNRISVHHSKEVEELKRIRPGWRGEMASILEAAAGNFSGKFVKAFVGVTPEIAFYQQERTRQPAKPVFVLPNGIDLDSVLEAADSRSDHDVNIVFIASSFADWHGLDKVFSLARCQGYQGPRITIHLVGRLTESQIRAAKLITAERLAFVVYGLLRPSEFFSILAKIDFGLASLAMERKFLREGSTLKVRELLAAGIPVLSTHADPSFPPYFEFYDVRDEISLEYFAEFANRVKRFSRDSVRTASEPFISKELVMRSFLEKLSNAANKGLI